MKIAVVTSFSQSGWAAYAQRGVESLLAHWPAEVEVWLYYEYNPPPITDPRVKLVELLSLPFGVTNFLEKWGHIPKWHGKVEGKDKENFRTNAVKFCRKVFAVEHCGLHCEADLLFWLDADSFTFADIPLAWIEGLLPEPHYLCHLGRKGYHSDCSLFGLRVGHPAHKEFLARYAGMYRTGRFEREREQHDSFLFDIVRTEMEKEKKILSYNLSETKTGHVFINSRLGQYMDTLKGRRKIDGHSWERDLEVARTEPYWQEVKTS